jgi:uncharacterized repeat protein (TIGR01451 family)
MEESISTRSVLAPSRFAVIALAAAMALILTLSVVAFALQTPDLSGSYKTGPLFTREGEEIEYTIVAVNVGDSVEDVILSDTLPVNTIFVPGSCIYRTSWGPPQNCGPLNKLWQEDLNTNTSITTAFRVKVTAGTMHWPLINCAYLSWESDQLELCFETIANPGALLPFVARDASNP